MKRKIAILLAAALAIPTISLSAASDNTLSKGTISSVPGTVVFEEGGGLTGIAHLFPGKDEPASNEKIIHYNSGTSANIKIKSAENAGATFKVVLENAKWFFRSNRTDITLSATQVQEITKLLLATSNLTTETGTANLTDTEVAALAVGTKDVLKFGSARNNLISESLRAELKKLVPSITIKAAFTGKADYAAILAAADAAVYTTDYTANPSASTLPTYTKDLDSEGGKRLLKDYAALPFKGSAAETMSTYNPDKGIYLPDIRTYVGFQGDSFYAMQISSDDYTGTLTLLKGIAADKIITVPLVCLVENEGDVRVGIGVEGNLTVISQTTMKFGESFKAKTETSVAEKEKITSKYVFNIPPILVKEKIAGSIQEGEVVLYAPYGYSFADPAKKFTEARDGFYYPYVRASGTLEFDNGKQVMVNDGTDKFIYYAKEGTKTLTDVLIIDTEKIGIKPTTQTNGILEIYGLQLMAQEYAPMDESVSLKIEGSGITTQEFVIGLRTDWGVLMEIAKDSKVTTLVNGRYTSATSGTEFDANHKTARVRFSEKIVASWWALRESEFSLPEGVKFRKVTILNEENFDHTNNNFKLNGDYTPNSDKTNYVQLTATKLRLSDLEIQKDKTAAFEMDIWVSVESGFEGDIALTAGGNEILKETKPVVIAKAVSPITIKADVKDLKIGYQWQQVSDILITETASGMLRRDKEVKVFIDDEISGSDSIAIAPDFKTELNTGTKLRFTKPTTKSGAISFTIEVPSYGNNVGDPGTIKFSNVFVKIDRTVAETNNRPYKIVAGGSAIAENFSTDITSVTPKFSVHGIGTNFFNVVTPAEGTNNGTLTTIVRVAIGSNQLILGKEPNTQTITMDTSAYISAASNSTMIPVRFVSQALGLQENQVQWDNEERTVTILNGSKVVQFKIGSSDLIINGVKTNMYSLDATPLKVKAEVKDNRSFLPLRALGTAFGINVGWDAATKTAIFNSDLLETATTNSTADTTAATAPTASTTDAAPPTANNTTNS